MAAHWLSLIIKELILPSSASSIIIIIITWSPLEPVNHCFISQGMPLENSSTAYLHIYWVRCLFYRARIVVDSLACARPSLYWMQACTAIYHTPPPSLHTNTSSWNTPMFLDACFCLSSSLHGRVRCSGLSTAVTMLDLVTVCFALIARCGLS